MAITALLLIALGVASEAVLGSFAQLFDWRWPKQRYPVGGNRVRVIGGRIALLVGVVLLLTVLIDAAF